MSDLKKEFGKRLKYLREQRGLTQDQLAEAIGKTPSTIAKIEQGVHGPRFDVFEKIVQALRGHPKDFFNFNWPN